MRTERLREKEEKYLVENVSKKGIWSREFVVYQWYEEINEDLSESKYKLIFDFPNMSLRAVRVVKKDLGDNVSEKEVFYLKNKDIDLYELLEQPFVAKRRSINENVFLDNFFKSNGRCKYLLEIEEQDGIEININTIQTEFTIIDNVTENTDYLNRNMTIPFTKKDLLELQYLIDLFID